MASVVSNSRGFCNGLDRSVERFEKKFQNRVKRLMSEAMRRLLRKTPVNTGQAIRNYVATAGTVYRGPVLGGNTPVEATNPLPLGAEQLRARNEGQAMATLLDVDYSDPYRVFYITNKTPHIGGLEAGELPEAPYTPRSPRGMFGVTLRELIALLEAGKV